MVWIMNVGMKPAYMCDSCGFGYRDPKLALACEGYCKKNKACSIEITAKAVFRP